MPKYSEYFLSSSKDVLIMEKELRSFNYPNTFVAVELAQNVINHGGGGLLKINGTSIESISNKPKFFRAFKAVRKANKFERGNIFGDMGFKMILAANWILDVKNTECGKLSIIAKKN